MLGSWHFHKAGVGLMANCGPDSETGEDSKERLGGCSISFIAPPPAGVLTMRKQKWKKKKPHYNFVLLASFTHCSGSDGFAACPLPQPAHSLEGAPLLQKCAGREIHPQLLTRPSASLLCWQPCCSADPPVQQFVLQVFDYILIST